MSALDPDDSSDFLQPDDANSYAWGTEFGKWAAWSSMFPAEYDEDGPEPLSVSMSIHEYLDALIPGLVDMQAQCPAEVCLSKTFSWEPSGLKNVIIHLNDTHMWSRKDIADWLDTLDLDLEFKTSESQKEVNEE